MSRTDNPSRSFSILPRMKPSYTTDLKRPGETRLPGVGWLPNRVRHLFISILGEFIGTFLFLFFAFAATQVANTGPSDTDAPPSLVELLYISLAFGLSLAVNVWVFFRISGGLFNPAVTIALALSGAIDWLKASLLAMTQIMAGIVAAGVVSAVFPGDLAVRTTLNPNTSLVRGLFIETFLTAELVFTIFMLAAEKHKATHLAPLGIGLALFVAELAGVWFTGGSLNPARSFGPDVILLTFDAHHWIYWIGPLLGAVLAVVFYRLIKFLEYETANPGADSDGQEGTRYFNSPESAENVSREPGRTDGTNETVYPESFGQPWGDARLSAMSQSDGFADTRKPSTPARPLPIYQFGGDGNRSDSESSVSRSDRSFYDGPDLESGSSRDMSEATH
ncbi:aquaporin-like protein [Dendryphion nanum]|uniref:Aquaporin-like protein n=1 Tax=Dendryphion nanum TaxID=256645 RepID=A0A9P9DXI8_9PLEO|nr:aquaporin-like protein [Dendryphion nanum]